MYDRTRGEILWCNSGSFSAPEMTAAAVSVSLLFLLSACSACYISNCPIGGKRSIMDAPQRKVSELRLYSRQTICFMFL